MTANAEVQVLTPPSSRQRQSPGGEDSDSDEEMMSLLNKYGDDAKEMTTSTEVNEQDSEVSWQNKNPKTAFICISHFITDIENFGFSI